jgi:AcrR family transcriptional regulator
MSLYNHIGSKAALLDGLHERLICSIELDLGDASWRDALRATARAYRQVALDHPRLFVLLATRPLATPAELAHIAPFLQVLIRKGLDAREQLFALNVFFTSLKACSWPRCRPSPGTRTPPTPTAPG